MVKVESFELDHRRLKAPFVRKCGVLQGKNGDKISKFDIRFLQPNDRTMENGAIHTIEHLLAGFLREKLEDMIDISPMGCRTGFYMTIWGDREVKEVISALNYGLYKVLEAKEVPAANEIQCGNYREHSLEGAQKYAKELLEKGITDKFYK